MFPIACLLLGSCINEVFLSLDAIATSIVDEAAEIQLLLAFGGAKHEYLHRVLVLAIQKGTSPILGMMRATGESGLLPILMCGQILSGSTLYQIMVMILVALCTVSSVVLSTMAATQSAFGPAEILKPDPTSSGGVV